MASNMVMRNLTRAVSHSSSLSLTTSSFLQTSARRSNSIKQNLNQSSRRQYSAGPSPTPPKATNNNTAIGIAAAVAVIAAGGYYFYSSPDVKVPEVHLKKGSAGETAGIFTPTNEDYQKVYNTIAKLLWEKDDYDDGSYGPVLVRLAWHCSGTYDAETGTGGSNGATMRFAPESDHGANAGLKYARDFLEPVKKQYPWISYSDLWTLAGVCAIQEMQGPTIPWRPGRQDRDVAFCSPDGRLPDGAREQNHIRAIFGRMGFSDQEMVALSGAHALGRCHIDRSGFEGPWTFSPTVMTNDYFRLLMEEKWGWRSWNGPKQFQDKNSKSLMMLPTDMALVNDKEFKKYVEKYAKDSQVFFKDFSSVVCKLFELGVPFKSQVEDRLALKTVHDQGIEA